MNLQSDATYSINGNGRLFNDFPADFRVPQFFPYSKADSRCPRVIHASRQTFNAPGRSVFQGRLSMPRVIPYSKADFRCPGFIHASRQTSDAGSSTISVMYNNWSERKLLIPHIVAHLSEQLPRLLNSDSAAKRLVEERIEHHLAVTSSQA